MKVAFNEIVAANFQVDPKLLRDQVPPGLELDQFNGDTYVSLVAMIVRKVGLFGIPLTKGFVDLSLRFFVRRIGGDDSTKGACFLRNYVSSATGAWLLSSQLGGEFPTMKMKSANKLFNTKNQAPEVDYAWKVADRWNKFRVKARSRIRDTGSNTKVGFVLDHTTHYHQFRGRTIEYAINRPRWEAWDAAQANFDCDVQQLFGKEFVHPLSQRPVSVFVSPGSDVSICKPEGR